MTSEFEDLTFLERVTPVLRQPETLEPTFESRLHSAVREAVAQGEAPWLRPTATGRRRGWRWLSTPRRLTVSPLIGLAAAAAFAAIIVGTTLAVSRGRVGAARQDVAALEADTASRVAGEVVHFIIAAPAARTVALVGDFNGWSPSATPLVRDTAAGFWTVTVPLAAGSYQYAFVVDGTAWIADPAAILKLKDEFGTPSSLITVRARRT